METGRFDTSRGDRRCIRRIDSQVPICLCTPASICCAAQNAHTDDHYENCMILRFHICFLQTGGSGISIGDFLESKFLITYEELNRNETNDGILR